MSRHHLIAHLSGKATATLYRNLANQTDKSGNGIRIFGWRKLAIIIETSKQPKRLLAVDREIPAGDLFGTKPSEESL
ncbi:hypothetical protein ACU5JM_09515 [Rhodococcus erythropolis]|uniref:hypothetical protein n=1 Tax=Rhodococcus erythropolis TaxID=1833 RepID=UPI00406BA4F1